MRVVLLGAPGSGKGTQATRLNERYRLLAISTNTMLREAVRRDSPVGRQVKAYLDLRQPVPDELVCAALKERLRELGGGDSFLLVGFPRTAAQGVALDEILEQLGMPLDTVLLLQGDPDYFMERLEGRCVCQSCGAIYNTYFSPPRVDGACDRCGGRVRRPPDDIEETIANRMRIFEQQSASLIQYYRLHGKLRQVRADTDPEQVFSDLCGIIEEQPPTVVDTEPVAAAPVPLTEAPSKTSTNGRAGKGAPAGRGPNKPAKTGSERKSAAGKRSKKTTSVAGRVRREKASASESPATANPKSAAGAKPKGSRKKTTSAAGAKRAPAKKTASRKKPSVKTGAKTASAKAQSKPRAVKLTQAGTGDRKKPAAGGKKTPAGKRMASKKSTAASKKTGTKKAPSVTRKRTTGGTKKPLAKPAKVTKKKSATTGKKATGRASPANKTPAKTIKKSAKKTAKKGSKKTAKKRR